MMMMQVNIQTTFISSIFCIVRGSFLFRQAKTIGKFQSDLPCFESHGVRSRCGGCHLDALVEKNAE